MGTLFQPIREMIMKMPKYQRTWDESSSPQWRFFQRNERKEKKNGKKLDIID
jgi:hypothetical protein|tara:strand:- start:153 stop:308 length:156 start_codon:yes stop_codon:yes gene_type:complete